MGTVKCLGWALAILLAWGEEPAALAGAVFQTDDLRLEIGPDGLVRSLIARPDGRELLARPEPVAQVYCGGQWVYETAWTYSNTLPPVYQGGRACPASRVESVGDRLTLRFEQAGVTAIYKVTSRPRYLALELVELEGRDVHHIDLLRLTLKRPPYLGTWLNTAYDDRFGVCLCAGNLSADAQMEPHPDRVTLKATAERASGLRGATAVLLGCREPQARLLDAMETVERDLQLPPGVAMRRSPLVRYSYLWAATPTPQNIDRYVDWAKRAGLRMLLFSYTAFSRGAGHFVWNDSYPQGMADLKRVTETVRRAGLELGLHIHYCKARKNDPYVTPVPDERLHKERVFTLAAPVDAAGPAIRVRENPAGCTLDKGRRILQIGKELIAYRDYSTEPPFEFTGCERGHLGTTPAAHRPGETVGLLDVDTWDIFIRYDQNTDIQDETAARLAEIFRQTGPYAMVYFDGAEDVHAPFWYHIGRAQHRVWQRLQPTPPVCEAPRYPNFSWHMITRGNAYDRIAPPDGMKDFCDLTACPSAAARARDFSRIEFGWLGNFGDSRRGYAGPDVIEYVVSRAAAWDCPVSLQLMPRELESNPRAEDCLAVIRNWEDVRLSGKLTAAQQRTLQNIDPAHEHYVSCYEAFRVWEAYRAGKLSRQQQEILAGRREHHLFVNESGAYELVEIREIPNLAEGRLKAYWFHRDLRPADTYVLLWAVRDRVDLRLPDTPAPVTLMRPFGKAIPVHTAGIAIDNRHYLVFSGMKPEQAESLLRQAK